jgi:3',5'-nucleoside bisphosphate phosphatase
MANFKRVDLHLHSTASDGTTSPAALVRAAEAAGLGMVALTDHDTVAGVLEAQAEAARCGVVLVPGIEMSAQGVSSEIHILGLGVDPTSPGLLKYGAHAGTRRFRRMVEMVQSLNALGFPVTMEDVEAEAGPDRENLARPHLARAMVRTGIVESVWEAFDRYLAEGQEAFVATSLIEAAEAIRLIEAAGGIPIWAHPTDEQIDVELEVLTSAGLQGIEVYRPRILSPRIRRLESLAARHGLLASGGSDWHGPEAGEALGTFFVDPTRIGVLIERLGYRGAA